jgi:endo-1,4-beta-D-glucanase Y
VAGQQVCSGTCTDTNSNTSNCGSCGHACTSGQSCTNGTCTGGGAGGTTGTAGSTGSGSGGTTGTAGTNGSGSGGTTGTAGTTGTGTGGSGARACAPASANVISDFEDGTGDVVVQGGRQGWWYVFADTLGGSQTPASNAAGPIAVAAATDVPPGDTAACDKWAMHSTATGHAASNTSSYEGFGVSLDQVIPPPASGSTSKTKSAVDVTAFDGISFNIKSGSGTAPPIWFELGNTETQPAPDGTAVNNAVDEYNTRGKLLSNVGTSWTTVYIPFGLLAPRYLPNLTESQCSNSSVNCQAPAWNPKSLLGLQFAVYPQFSTSTLNYDLWVDDVALYTGANGLATVTASGSPMHPFPVDSAMVGSCAKPTGTSGKFLADAYNKWKSTFVTGSGASTRVQRPENSNDTVSEGIGYGMLIAVAMGDKTLFDGLWSYSQAHVATGMLMTWDISSGGGNAGTGSATDADEDMAFALIQAGKQWGGTYAATAKTMIGQIWSSDIDTTSNLPTGGSNYGNSTSSHVTNPSYFAPAYYRAFATIDTGHAWNTVATNVYSAIASIETKVGTQGLIPAWCSNNCTAVGTNGGADDQVYQYDAHRVAWRLGVDACWNSGSVPASGKTFLTNNAAFFASKAASGIGRIVDIYTLSGGANGDAAPNSMSVVGTAGVGAMAVGNAFMNSAYRFILDATYTPASTIPDSGGKIAYTYFNATVGLLSALTMSGNLSNF